MSDAIAEQGFSVIPSVLPEHSVTALVNEIAAMQDTRGTRRRESVYAVRNLLWVPAARALAQSATVRALVEPTLGPDCFAVRGILFDKTPDANWKVVWHQDLSIAVRERREAAGFGPWSEKAGVTHVQPPAAVLERMLTVRLHLDDCGEENGPLRVLPGSHRQGRLGASDIARLTSLETPVSCAVSLGGALLMRPLLLHASSASRAPGHRRVVHLEFAAGSLPAGLQWHDRVGSPEKETLP